MPLLERSSIIIRKLTSGAIDSQPVQRSNFDIASAPSCHIPITQEVKPSSAYRPQPKRISVNDSYHPADTDAGFVAPLQWQSDLRSILYPDPDSVMEEHLPAFPGQGFPAGSEPGSGSSEVNLQTGGTFLGHNLDPQPTLNADDIIWQLMDAFEDSTVTNQSM